MARLLNTYTWEEDLRRFKSLSECRYYCYCGHWVYKDKQKYFKERLKGYINENTIK